MSFFGALGGLLGAGIGTLVAPGIGTAIGAGIGLSAGGSIDSSNAVSESNASNLQSVRETNQANKELAEKNIAYQVRENQRNRDFNAAEAQKAFEREKEMFMFQANYNSPMEQVKRAAAAGINPASVMGQGSTIASSGPSNGAASYGTGVSPSMPNMVAGQVAPVPGMATGLIDSLKQLTEAKQAFSQSGLNDAQSHKILTLLESELEGQVLDNQTKQFALEMEKAFGPAMRKASVQKLVMDGLLAYRQCENAIAEGDKLRADAALSRSVTALNDAKKQTEGKQQALLDKQIGGYDSELRARINNLNSAAGMYREQGRLARSEYNRIDRLLPEEEKYQKLSNGEKAVALLEAWQEWKLHKLTPEQFNLMREKITAKLEQEAKLTNSTWWNPVTSVAWLLDPLAHEVGIAFTGNASASYANKPKAPKVK